MSGMAKKCVNCGVENTDDAERCEDCGIFFRPAIPLGHEVRAQVLATLIQSQENTTWLAFSLAMTIETLLLVTFTQIESNGYGRGALFLAGILLGVGFWSIVHRSNVDMRNLYNRAARDYQDTFHFLNAQRFPRSKRWRITTRRVVDIAFVVLVAGWIVVFSLYATGHFD